MTVVMIHLITTSAESLDAAWSDRFKPATFGDPEPDQGPVQAFGPSLPDGVRGVSLVKAGASSIGITLFDSYADARQYEPELREFWSEVADGQVSEGMPGGVWRPSRGLGDDDNPARMIWVAPAAEIIDVEVEPESNDD